MPEGESRHGAGERPPASLAELVAERVAAVQAQYLAGTSAGVSQLAALRRAATMPVGADPRTWELTVAEVSPWARGDEATDEERAVHAALTLYALHQQSKDRPMHRPGSGLGAAVRALGEATHAKDAVRRRFEALGTAATFPELLHHARGLVGQLRSAGIPMDYARFARDLSDWQAPTRAASARLRWGREYHRVPRPDTRIDSTQETA